MKKRSTIDVLQGMLGEFEGGYGIKQRNVKIDAYADACVWNMAQTARVPFQVMLGHVLRAGLESLEESMGREAFERAAQFDHGFDEDGNEISGPLTLSTRLDADGNVIERSGPDADSVRDELSSKRGAAA